MEIFHVYVDKLFVSKFISQILVGVESYYFSCVYTKLYRVPGNYVDRNFFAGKGTHQKNGNIFSLISRRPDPTRTFSPPNRPRVYNAPAYRGNIALNKITKKIMRTWC